MVTVTDEVSVWGTPVTIKTKDEINAMGSNNVIITPYKIFGENYPKPKFFLMKERIKANPVTIPNAGVQTLQK